MAIVIRYILVTKECHFLCLGFAYMYVCTPGACGGQKSVSDPPQLEARKQLLAPCNY